MTSRRRWLCSFLITVMEELAAAPFSPAEDVSDHAHGSSAETGEEQMDASTSVTKHRAPLAVVSLLLTGTLSTQASADDGAAGAPAIAVAAAEAQGESNDAPGARDESPANALGPWVLGCFGFPSDCQNYLASSIPTLQGNYWCEYSPNACGTDTPYAAWFYSP